MGAFSLDIERLYEELEESGQILRGIFCIQYPIYCIHAHITDTTADPLDNLDKGIVDFLALKPDISTLQISSLMGTSKAVVEARIAKLLHDELIKRTSGTLVLTEMGIQVFMQQSLIRQHRRSYDFYLDGITLQPLPREFYTIYQSKYISENDAYFRTSSKGENYLVQPFGPDIVHTPPDKTGIAESIFGVNTEDRELYFIPLGLESIDDIAFTRLSLQLLVSVSSKGDKLIKEIIDGFAIYSLSQNKTYYEILRKNVQLFDPVLQSRITNLEFRINTHSRRSEEEQPKISLQSNWQIIDGSSQSGDRCFSFSIEDLLRLIREDFKIRNVEETDVENKMDQIQINITKRMLLTSQDRQKLISALLRKRDYTWGVPEKNVFLLYLYYTTEDQFVQQIMDLKKSINNTDFRSVTISWIQKYHPSAEKNYRQLLIAGGEFELLERLDIERHMLSMKQIKR